MLDAWRPSRILVVNAGASTLKVALFEAGPNSTRCLRRATRTWGSGQDRAAITKAVLKEVGRAPDLVGHRVVHGGAAFRRPVCVDAQVEAAIESLIPLAPLHNEAALQAIRTSREVFVEAPCVAVFDTAFHAERPRVSMHYALPEELTEPLQIRRYGFHGIAHAALIEETADAEGITPSEVTAVTLQLGAGCSACAVREGRSIETSMGFTPLEGLVMATRCGNIDPAIVVQLVRRGFDAARIEEALTARSGLRALAASSDVREILTAEAKGDERARFALQCFVHHILLTVGAYFTLLDGRGSLVFGGGIGANSPEIRKRVASGLGAWDVVLDGDCNTRNPPGRISRAGHRPVFVFETDEERVIARQVAELFTSAWHAISPEAAIAHYGTSRSAGLSAAEARRRLAQYGPNRLPEAKPRSALRRFIEQFRNLLIYVLLGSAAITAALGHAVDTAVILGVVIINALAGFVQEGRAEKALDAIRGMLAPKASVLRDGRRITVSSVELVPGDLVLLEAGDRVPADLRLVRARNLQIQEAVLTGESAPVEKSSASVAPDTPPADRTSMAFSGTLVSAGQGTGVAAATGSGTELGRISTLIGAVETVTTPLLRQMDRFARWLTGAILGVSALVYAIATLGRAVDPGDAFRATVGIAVAAIPERLPAVLTIALARGVHRMAVQNAIIRRLPAVETLGSVSVICTDKTGTLTRNEMTVRTVVTAAASFEVGGVGYEPRGAFRSNQREVEAGASATLSELARAGLLCNDASLRQTDAGWIVEGDPMEGALVSLAVKASHDADLVRKQLPRSDEIPFDGQHRFMATLHHSHENSAFLYVKGAPERVLEMCDHERGMGGDAPLDATFWHRHVESLASEGQRVLAIAVKRMPAEKQALAFSDAESGLVLLGLLGLMDPPREEAVEAVRECRTAGIRVKMITGDHTATARAIASRLALENTEKVVTGQRSTRSTMVRFGRWFSAPTSLPAPALSTSCGSSKRCRPRAPSWP